MESILLQNQNDSKNNKTEKEKEKKNNIQNKNIINNINNNDENLIINNGQDENNNLLYIAKRSYSCKINEPKNKKFVNNEDIKLNLNKKFMYLKTPQIKPKKSQLNPVPINLGSISYANKKPKFNLLNDNINIINDIISEGDNEESNEFSYDSSSDFTDGEEIKKKIDSLEFDFNEEKSKNEIDNNNNFLRKINTEKIGNFDENKIVEENDDYDENGKISLKNVRKDLIQSKRIFLKNDIDIFDKIDKNIMNHFQKYKEDILMNNDNDNETDGIKLHKTTGFGQPHPKYGLPILEFLKKNSSSGLNKK